MSGNERREPFDRSRAGFYVAHRVFEDPNLADVAADDHQVAALVRMLHQSDRQAGAPVMVPRSVKQGWVDRWIAAGLIELAPGDCYTVPGVAEAATKRIEKAKAAALARWSSDAPGTAQSIAPRTAQSIAPADAQPMPTVTVSGVVGAEPLHQARKRAPSVSPALKRPADDGREDDSDEEAESAGRAESAPGLRVTWCEDPRAHRPRHSLVDGHYRCAICAPRLGHVAKVASLAVSR